jgi:p-aminobenzoyl-glutamate transporter AbgT
VLFVPFFVLFRLCIFILICFVCTGVRTTATEWQLNCSQEVNDDDDDNDKSNNNNNNNQQLSLERTEITVLVKLAIILSYENVMEQNQMQFSR